MFVCVCVYLGSLNVNVISSHSENMITISLSSGALVHVPRVCFQQYGTSYLGARLNVDILVD